MSSLSKTMFRLSNRVTAATGYALPDSKMRKLSARFTTDFEREVLEAVLNLFAQEPREFVKLLRGEEPNFCARHISKPKPAATNPYEAQMKRLLMEIVQILKGEI